MTFRVRSFLTITLTLITIYNLLPEFLQITKNISGNLLPGDDRAVGEILSPWN